MGFVDTGIRTVLAFKGDQFTRGLRNVQRQVSSFNTATSDTAKNVRERLGGAVTSVATTGVEAFKKMKGGVLLVSAAIAGATFAAVRFLSTIARAGAAQEATNLKFAVVFQQTQQKALSFANALGEATGRNVGDLQSALSGFGDMLKPIGIAEEDALRLSGSLTQVGLALAAFNGKSDADAFAAISSALAGSTRGLRAYGVNLDETKIKTEAVTLGLARHGDALTDQQKAIATTSLIRKQSADAIEAFSKADGLATEQTKRFKAAIASAHEDLGLRFNKSVLEAIDGMGGMETVTGTIVVVMGSLYETLIGTGRVLGGLLKAVFGADMGLKALRVTSLLMVALFQLLVAGVTPIVEGLKVLGTIARVSFSNAVEGALALYDALTLNWESVDRRMDKIAEGAYDIVAAMEEAGDNTAKAGIASAKAWKALKEEMDGTAEASRKNSAALRELELNAEEMAKSYSSAIRFAATSHVNSQIEMEKATLTRLANEEKAKNDELRSAEQAKQAHVRRLAAITGERVDLKDDVGSRVFKLGLSSLKQTGDQVSVITARIAQLQTESNTLRFAGEFERARSKLEEVMNLIEQVSSLEGFSNVVADQQQLLFIGRQLDQLFIEEAEAQTKLKEEAQRSIDTLTEELKLIGEKTDQGKKAIEAFNAAIKEIDQSTLEEVEQKWGAIAKQTEAAAKAAKDFAGASSAVTSAGGSPGGLKGFAAGGAAVGPHDPRDNILALLRAGETVLTPEQSKMLAPQLHAAGVPGFAGGGLADGSKFQGIVDSTREYSAYQRLLSSIDRNRASALFQRRLAHDRFGLSSSFGAQGYGTLSQSSAPSIAAPFMAGSISPSGLPGFSGGGAVGGGGSSVSVGDIHIDFKSSGGTERDAEQLGHTLRRLIKRGIVKLT